MATTITARSAACRSRIDQLQRQISQLDRRNILSEREARPAARRIRASSSSRLRYAARNGLNGRERYDIERGIQRLEVRIQREARDGNRYGYRGGYGYGDGWSDRDRDGRNDRYENDRGRRPRRLSLWAIGPGNA